MKKISRIENKKFYRGKKVLITGHTGFKGAWLTGVLNSFDCETVGYALKPVQGCLYEQIEGDKLIKSQIGELENYKLLEKNILEFQPEIIIHLAAFGFISECYNNPIRTYSSNVMGTVNLMEILRQCDSIKSVIIVSTDKVYKNIGDGVIYGEEDAIGGNTPYSCSKTCMELLVNDYYETYFKSGERKIGIGIVRASNVLAGGDHIQTRLIPTILNSIDNGNPVELRNPDQTRPWQSVLDALDGYLTIARFIYYDPVKYSGTWNIGPLADGIKSVKWVFEKIESYFSGLKRMDAQGFDVAESKTLGLDISKAINELDWKPYLSTEKILEWVVDFYKGQKRGENIWLLCKKQIDEYYGGRINEMG